MIVDKEDMKPKALDTDRPIVFDLLGHTVNQCSQT